MEKRAIPVVFGAFLAFAAQSFVGGCSGPASGSSDLAPTKEQKVSLIDKSPLREADKQKLREQVEQGRLKGP